MEKFNKHTFINDLKEEIEESIKDGYLESADDIHEYITDSIDNECIYYSNCYEIMQDLHLFQWDEPSTTIAEVAYYGLYEWVFMNIDIDEFDLTLAENG